MTFTTKCLSCKQPRHARAYLCWPCWRQLPAQARYTLLLKDDKAGIRLIELTHQLADRVPLGEIEVSP